MKYLSVILFFVILFFESCSFKQSTKIDLSGEWSVTLDSLNQGLESDWASKKLSGQTISLPGTLDDAGMGKKSTLEPELNNFVLSGLTRKHQYIGAAWYQKEVKIPQNWKGKHIELNLERIIWESQVFVDGNPVGKNQSLVAPHRYNLTEMLAPGKHLISVRIDNSNYYPFINIKGDRYPDPVNQDMAHAYTNHTQIKWNGITGEISLSATNREKIENIQVYTDLENGTLKAKFENNIETGEIYYQVCSVTGEILSNGTAKNGTGEIVFDRPEGMQAWDEFNPELYILKLFPAEAEVCDTASVRFGYRQVSQEKQTLLLNGKRIFLRGNLECAIFPLTGRPPMKKAEWAKLIDQAKAYGLNHLRFHSWCPPKAAFDAADEAGFYFQVELPLWNLEFGKDKKTIQYLLSEKQRILTEYGNHPSFILMSLGNELKGNIGLMNTMVADLKKEDNRHLYTTTTFSFQSPLGKVAQPEDEFFITQRTDKGWIRGQGIFNAQAPAFNEDYTATSHHVPVPLISHEIGQYAVFPDMAEIEKYTGVLKPLNFTAVKNDLEKKGLLPLAGKFTQASGKLAAILYKEEIERALKTPAFDGFQLLQLQDFPGQGTALVGLLNAFWESKGVISAEEFRKFNSELVPLLRFEKAVYENGETYEATVEVANFFKEMQGQTLAWKVTGASGKEMHSGRLENINLQIGNNPEIGTIKFPLQVEKAAKLILTLALEGTGYENNWNIWVYPKSKSKESGRVLVTSSFEEANKALQQGRKVLLNPDYKQLEGIQGRFVPVFWSPVHFPNQPSTMGLLVDEEHPAFNDFPTDWHSDWQWWDLCIQSKSIILDSVNVTPLVRVIDNFVTNHNLASVFEVNVGKGKLIFSSIDLISDLKNRPVARQLRSSLLQYMESDDFNPEKNIGFDKLNFMDEKRKKDFTDSDIYN